MLGRRVHGLQRQLRAVGQLLDVRVHERLLLCVRCRREPDLLGLLDGWPWPARYFGLHLDGQCHCRELRSWHVLGHRHADERVHSLHHDPDMYCWHLPAGMRVHG